MQKIGDEMQKYTSALMPATAPLERLQVLDLCMAPGGYSASALKYHPDAALHGISLPPSNGGHELLLQYSGLQVVFTDITMLASEFATLAVPPSHPDAQNFDAVRPFLGQSFHLVFCDGQVLRTHTRGDHRKDRSLEALRLTISQLILALQRIKAGGTLVMLLHGADTWQSFFILHTISRSSKVQLFKPRRIHADRGSFYLIAKNVQPASPLAQEAVEEWKTAWWCTTFGGDNGTGQMGTLKNDASLRRLLDDFGKKYVTLVKPIFGVQRKALARKHYTRY